jgi:lipoprotein-releasing system ATP-binding protein
VHHSTGGDRLDRACGRGCRRLSKLGDRDLTRLRGHAIGFVFQSHHLIGAFTALENVMLPMLGAEEFPNATMETRAAALLESVGLTA